MSQSTRAGASPPGPSPAATPARPADAAARVLRQFRQVFNSVKTHFQQMEKETGVGGAQLWALSVICERPGIGVNDVARAMDIRQPTASNLVRALSEQGHVEVRREGSDRRAVQLHATVDGMRLLKRAPGPFTGVLPQALAELPQATLQQLESSLAALIRALDADAAGGRLPLGGK